MYLLLFCLILAVVFVNGWTDAPNAITCVVSTRVLPYSRAVRMAAACNLLGIVTMGLLNASVADTISAMVRLDPVNPDQSVAVLCAAMLAIVLFAVVAWYFGIPTSESHALIAALTGAALAQGRAGAINWTMWDRVLWGMGLSLLLGFGLGWLITKLLGGVLRNAGGKVLDRLQILAGAGMAFMHGAQDGQKFIGVFVLAACTIKGVPAQAMGTLRGHLPVMALCAGVMALGTMAGGRRIIACVGGKMVALEKYQGACADLGGALCLLAASWWGIPMSTTHTKTTAIMGAGAAASRGGMDTGIVKSMFATWVFTFPVCGMIGYLAAALLLRWH